MKIYIEALVDPEDLINVDSDRTIIFENSTAKFRIRFDGEEIYINKIAINYAKDNDILSITPISKNGVGIK